MPWDIESVVDSPGAPYDNRAAVYDRLVRSGIYNRLAWSTSPRDYARFAACAAASAAGPLLEVAAGSAAATADIHLRSRRTTVLLDRSKAMLERAAGRLAAAAPSDPAASARIRLVQADLWHLPFAPHGFDTVLALGAAHLFENLRALREVLVAQLAPSGELHIAGLVAATRRGRRYLDLLHHAGETAAPRSANAMRSALEPAEFRVHGCMAYAVIRAEKAANEGS